MTGDEVTTHEQLRALLGQPGRRTLDKERRPARGPMFIRVRPTWMVGYAMAEARVDVPPG
jgi:hypothetical protein